MQEIAGPQFGGIRAPWYPAVSTGLTPYLLSSVLQSSQQGDIEQLLLLAEEMEEREPHYASVLQTRKLAVRSLTFTVEPTGETRRERKLAEEVQRIIDGAPFRRCITDLLDAIAKGFSVVEVIWDTTKTPWSPVSFVHQPAHYFKFDERIYRQLLIRSEQNANGVEMPEGKFIVHVSKTRSGPIFKGGIARTVASFYLAKNYALRDWVNFCDVYGLPLRIGKHAPNASADDRQALLSAIRSMGNSAAAIMPTSMQIETQEGVTGSHGSAVFGDLIKAINAEISKLVLGQTMTTEDGSSLSQAKVHDSVRNDILWADAQDLADTINEQLIKQYVALNYGEDVPAPLLKITQDEREDLSVLGASLIPFIDRGLTVSQAEIAQKFGLQSPDAVQDPLTAPMVMTPPQTPQRAEEEDEDDEEEDENKVEMNAKPRQRSGVLDDIVDESLDDWQIVMDPLIAPIVALANRAQDFAEFKRDIKGILRNVDTSRIVQSLAYNAFLGRVEASEDVQEVVGDE